MWPNTVVVETPESDVKSSKWVFGCGVQVVTASESDAPTCVIWVLKALKCASRVRGLFSKF